VLLDRLVAFAALRRQDSTSRTQVGIQFERWQADINSGLGLDTSGRTNSMPGLTSATYTPHNDRGLTLATSKHDLSKSFKVNLGNYDEVDDLQSHLWVFLGVVCLNGHKFTST